MQSLVVGIDAGGTHVRLAFADARTGEPVGETLLIVAAPSGEPPTQLVPDSPESHRRVVAVCAGVAKYTRPGVVDEWDRFLRARFPDALPRIVPDYEIAFHAGMGQSGVVVVAGTGSVAYGENAATGEKMRVGGRGWEWGDEGSGAWLSTEMVRRTLRALDGQAHVSALTRAVCAELGTNDPAQLAAEARARAGADGGAGRGFLLPLLSRSLGGGDTEARDLFTGAGGWLASLAVATATRLRFGADGVGDPVTFGAAGGVWRAGGDVTATAFRTAVTRRFPAVIFRFDTPAPVFGAVRIALRMAGEIRSE